MRSALNVLVPVLAGLTALAVYIRTLYPGLVSIGDSPKFQFVGPILGTPHNPGYPLYIVVSHAFSYFPIGTIAFRMNLMSAVFGAVTVALMAMVVRRVTGSGIAGAGAALMLAFGRVFWSQATIAEVYTLAAALLAATLLFVIRWTQTRRPRDLVAAAAFVALALGNHITIILIVPLLLLFVLVTDWRAAIRIRVGAPAAVLLLAGGAQYLLLLHLTSQQPAYLESAATDLGGLLSVMRGAQFAERLFTSDLRTVLAEHNPALLRILVQELRPWGLLLAAVGTALLILRGWRALAGFVIGASFAVWTFVLNYAVADPQVFLIPLFVLSVIPVGTSLAWICRNRLTRARPLLRGAVSALVLAPALVMLAGNYRVSDHHRRTFETRLFDAIFRAVPDGSVVVPGTFAEHLMLTYKLEAEGLRQARGIRQEAADRATLRQVLRNGQPVFAFPAAVDALSWSGLMFEPVKLWDESLPTFVAGLPPGSVVVAAGSGFNAAGTESGPAFPHLGARTALTGQIHRDYALIGAVGAEGGAIEAVGPGAAVTLQPGQTLGPVEKWTGPTIDARAERGGTIWLDGTVTVEAPDAVAVVVLNREGLITRQAVADPTMQLRVPFESDPALFRLASARDCRDVGNLGWIDVSSIAAGGTIAARVDNYRPFDAHLRFVVWSDRAVVPSVRAWQGPGTPSLSVSDASPTAIQAAGLPATVVPDTPFASFVAVRFNDDGQFVTFVLELGATISAAFVSAAVDLNNPRRATICSGDSM